MSNYTTYKSLEKPLSTEKYDIAVTNKNTDIIDSELNKLEQKAQSQEAMLEAEIERATNADLNLKNDLAQEIERASGAENRLTTNLNAVVSSVDVMDGQMTTLTDQINNLRAEDIGALSTHDGGTITNSEGESLNISAAGLSGHGNQIIDGFYYIDAHQILQDGEDVTADCIKNYGDTMTGNLDMNNNQILNISKIKKTDDALNQPEIDMDSTNGFEIGIRQLDEWYARLGFSNNGEVKLIAKANNLPCGGRLDLTDEFNLTNTDRNVEIKSRNSSLDLSSHSSININANGSAHVNGSIAEIQGNCGTGAFVKASASEFTLNTPGGATIYSSSAGKNITLNTPKTFHITAETIDGHKGTNNCYPKLNNIDSLLLDDSMDYTCQINTEELFSTADDFSIGLRHEGNPATYGITVSSEIDGSVLMPYQWGDGKGDLGCSDVKWRNIYAKNGTIQTSDRTQKTNITDLSVDLSKDFIMGLRPSAYGMADGTSGRTHWGLIAQDIEELMTRLDMDSKDFAGFIKSPHYELNKIEQKTETGQKIYKTTKVLTENQYDYSLRYDEFIAPMIKVIQDLNRRVEELEKLIP